MALIHTSEFEEQSSTPTTPATGRRAIYPKAAGWYDLDDAGTETQLAFQTGNMALLFSQTTDGTVADTVTQSNLLSTGAGSVTLPANTFEAGTIVRLYATGHVSTTSTPTLDWEVELGGTDLGNSGGITLGDTISNVGWRMWLDIVCRTTGATGTVVASGVVRLGEQLIGIVKTTTTTVDTTGTLAIELLVTWGTASASNTITLQTATIQRLAVTGL